MNFPNLPRCSEKHTPERHKNQCRNEGVSGCAKKHMACRKKYKPCILKYKALISKYMPCIFHLFKCLKDNNLQKLSKTFYSLDLQPVTKHPLKREKNKTGIHFRRKLPAEISRQICHTTIKNDKNNGQSPASKPQVSFRSAIASTQNHPSAQSLRSRFL